MPSEQFPSRIENENNETEKMPKKSQEQEQEYAFSEDLGRELRFFNLDKLREQNPIVNSDELSEQFPSMMENEKLPSQEKKGELSDHLAKELREPENGSYLNKLKRIITGLTLVGVTFGQAQEVISPTISDEKLIAASLPDLELNKYPDSETRSKIQLVLNALENRGGLKESNELDLTGRPKEYGEVTFAVSRKAEIPFYFKPENILGRKFITENSEIAVSYLEKINHAIHATVCIITEDGQGSGTVINTKRGIAILTNEHVVGKNNEVYVEFANQTMYAHAKVVAQDKNIDLALLEVEDIGEVTKFKGLRAEGKKTVKSMNAMMRKHGVEALNVMSDQEFADIGVGEGVASIGNPAGYPFTTSMTRISHFENNKSQQINSPGKENMGNKRLYLKPDERFKGLAIVGNSAFSKLEDKGKKKYEPVRLDSTMNYFGKSGGPSVSLDRKYEPKLLGLNVDIYKTDDRNGFSGIVMASDINKFLEKNDF